jgi:nitrate/nitrite transporter NarK
MISDEYLAFTSMLSSIFNALGRPAWGALADRISFQVSMKLSFCEIVNILQAAACIANVVMCALLLTFRVTTLFNEWAFIIWVCALYDSNDGV